MPDSIHPAFFVVIVAIWVVLAIVMGFLARSKGYSMAVGIAISVLTPFVAAIIILAILPDQSEKARSKAGSDSKRRMQFEKAKHNMFERARTSGQREDANIHAIADVWKDSRQT